jgi:excisionase family DNA binding protein
MVYAQDVDTDGELLKVAQAADKLQVDPETVRRWLRDGRIRGINLGTGKGGWRIRSNELERFLKERER